MGSFMIECPKCGTINSASTSIFAKKNIRCGNCKEEINVKDSRFVSKRCPSCEKAFMVDQSKHKKRPCPYCGKTVDPKFLESAEYSFVTVNCPQCSCAVEVDSKAEGNPTCPICDAVIDVKKLQLKEKLVDDNHISVIQYEGDNLTFIWKHPIENFNSGSQLIVHESQEAIFFLNGQALDLFGPGRYTLETGNLPMLKKLCNIADGAQTPFRAEIYFINKVTHMGIKWGTDSRVHFVDPKTNIPLDIGASGEMNVRVADSRKLLVKLVGTESTLINKRMLEAAAKSKAENDAPKSDLVRAIQAYFRAPLVTSVKSFLASVIRDQGLNIFELDSHMESLSRDMRDRISPALEEYGLAVSEFYIMRIDLPENNEDLQKIRSLISKAYLDVRAEEVAASVAEAARQRKLIEAQTEAQVQAMRAQGEAEATRAVGLAEADVMRAKGYSQKDVLEADVQVAYAESLGKMGSAGGGAGNGGTAGGGFASDMVGMMASMKMAETMFDKMGNMNFGSSQQAPASPAAPATPAANGWTCACGETGNVGKFCMNCGNPKPEVWDCACGHKGNRGKFCEECGSPKAPATWDCACGQTGNTGKCCPECGAKRP